MLSTVSHDASREASASVAGTLYHVMRAVEEWSTLGDDEALYLEGAEDMDRLASGRGILIQLRKTVGKVSLNQEKILQGIGHFWQNRERNPATRLRYRYSTIAGVAMEKGNPFGFGRPGIDVWRDIQNSDDPSFWNPLVERLSEVFVADDRLPASLRTFLRSSTPAEVRACLVEPVEFDTWADDLDETRARVRRIVIKYGRDRNIDPAFSTRAIPALAQAALAAMVDPHRRRLLRVDWDDEFKHAVSTPLPPGQMVTGMAADGNVLIVGISDLVKSVPRPSSRYFRRKVLRQSLEQQIAARGLAFVVGSSGKGKSQLVADHVDGSPDWVLLDFYGADADGVSRVVSGALAQLRARGQFPNVVVEDFNPGSSNRAAAALIDLRNACHDANASMIVTSYSEPDRPLRDGLGLYQSSSVRIGDFDELETATLLAERGAPGDRIKSLARLVMTRTGGHPTLIDVTVDALRSADFPQPTVEQFLDAPQEIAEERQRFRQFVGSLPPDEQSMIYRLSLSTRALLRRQILAVGAVAIPPEGSIRNPGTILDRLVGPWLEFEAGEKRYRLSTMLYNAAQFINDETWMTATRRALATALLSSEEVDVRDAAEALVHALAANAPELVARILTPFADELSSTRLRTLAVIAPWLSGVGIDVPPIAALSGPLLTPLLRMIQYRLASVTSNSRLAGSIVEHFEREIFLEDEPWQPSMRFLFYSSIMLRPVERGPRLMERALAFIGAADGLDARAPGVVRQILESMGTEEDREDDIVALAGSLVFACVRDRNDLDAVSETLRGREAAFAARFLAWLDRTTIAWRGVAASIVIAEEDLDEPDHSAVVASLQSFAEIAVEAELPSLATDVIAFAAVVEAENVGDVAAAEEMVVGAEQKLGTKGRFARARAVLRFAANDWPQSLDFFERSFRELVRDLDDPELPIDLRLAAIAASEVGDFSKASRFLERAASVARTKAQPTFTSALLFDAAYASWRGGDDEDALRLVLSALPSLRAVQESIEDERLQNSIRRAAHVTLEMSQATVSDRDDGPLASVGFASNTELLPPFHAIVPIGAVCIGCAAFESRVAGTTEILQATRSEIEAAGDVPNRLARFLTLLALARVGAAEDVIRHLATLTANSEAATDVEGGSVPGPASLDELVALSLVGRLAMGPLDSAYVRSLQLTASEIGHPTSVRWCSRILRFIANPELAMAVLEQGGSGNEDRMLAAIAMHERGDGSRLRLAEEVMTAYFIPVGRDTLLADVFLATARTAWRRFLDSVTNDGFIPLPWQPLADSLNGVGGSRRRLLGILRGAAHGVNQSVSPYVTSLLDE